LGLAGFVIGRVCIKSLWLGKGSVLALRLVVAAAYWMSVIFYVLHADSDRSTDTLVNYGLRKTDEDGKGSIKSKTASDLAYTHHICRGSTGHGSNVERSHRPLKIRGL